MTQTINGCSSKALKRRFAPEWLAITVPSGGTRVSGYKPPEFGPTLAKRLWADNRRLIGTEQVLRRGPYAP